MPRTKPKETYLIEAYMVLAENIAKASTCSRASHGCVLTTVDLNNVLAIGYNGSASRTKNGCKHPDIQGACGCGHAEMNALVKAAPGDKVAFITCQPCYLCATLLINGGVKKIYTISGHRDFPESLDLLAEAHVEHVKLTLNGRNN